MLIATEIHYSYENIGIFAYFIRKEQGNSLNLYLYIQQDLEMFLAF